MHCDLDIEFPESDEPTHAPIGDECEPSARGENCGRTDCDRCGEDAAAWLCVDAIASTAGVIALAREINRSCNADGGGKVTARDLARIRDRSLERSHKTWSRSWAWAEGVLDAVDGRPAWLQRHDYEHDAGNRAAYVVGRLLVELHFVKEHLTCMEAQAMADTDITFAAGALPSDAPSGPQSDARRQPSCGLGFESRAQHR